MMRIIVDQERCVGHGRCHAEAPEIYELDDLGFCSNTEFDVPSGSEGPALAGANACPERAIQVVETSTATG